MFLQSLGCAHPSSYRLVDDRCLWEWINNYMITHFTHTLVWITSLLPFIMQRNDRHTQLGFVSRTATLVFTSPNWHLLTGLKFEWSPYAAAIMLASVKITVAWINIVTRWCLHGLRNRGACKFERLVESFCGQRGAEKQNRRKFGIVCVTCDFDNQELKK